MPIVQSKKYSNKTFTISHNGYKETISCDVNGKAEITDRAFHLLQNKYDYKGFSLAEVERDDIIEKVEKPEPLQKEQGEPIKTPKVEEKEPAKILEEENVTLEEIINNITAIDELKTIASELGLPKEEWETKKRIDFFKKYLIEKVNESTEKEEA